MKKTKHYIFIGFLFFYGCTTKTKIGASEKWKNEIVETELAFAELAQKEMDRDGFGLAYLDLANPEAIRFMEQVWDEVCPLFDSKLVHIGTDEYRINLIKDKEEREDMGEQFRKYINHLNSYITKKHGKVVRTWSGYEHLPGKTEPDTSIIIDMWETADAKTLVQMMCFKQGHGQSPAV